VDAAGQALDGVLGVRHEPDDVPPGAAHAGDVGERAVGVRLRRRAPGAVGVAEDDAPLALERRERVLVGDVAALAVLHRQLEHLAGAAALGEEGVGRLDPHRDQVAHEAERAVAHQRAGEEAHPPAHQRRSSASSTRKSSITPLASSRSHISRTRAVAAWGSASRSLSSMYLPTFTSCTSAKPRAWSELWTALPWGSKMPRFGVT